MRRLIFLSMLMGLSGCMEPQIAPDLPKLDISNLNIEVIAEGLDHPWSVAADGGGRYYVTERGGKLFQITNNSRTEITGLPDDIYVEGQAGLFDVVLPSDFVRSDKIYLTYAYGTADSNGTALISAKLNVSSLTETKTLFRASPPKDTNAHFGARLAILPDQSLILTTGEGFKYREAAQDLDSHLGKTVRLTANGGTPSDNPKLGGKPQIYSYGHRNVQGLAYDAQTGTLWSHEHGARGGDELNIIIAGENYGWPIATQGTDYNGAKITPHKTYPGMKDGAHIWTPSIAPSGLAIYRGDMFPDWDGDALVGGLASQDLRLVDLENGKSVGETIILSNTENGLHNGRIRDVRVERDGAILVLIDAAKTGKLLRITPKK